MELNSLQSHFAIGFGALIFAANSKLCDEHSVKVKRGLSSCDLLLGGISEQLEMTKAAALLH